MFAGGMALAVYGFLHTKGGEFVAGEVSKESKTQRPKSIRQLPGRNCWAPFVAVLQATRKEVSVVTGNMPDAR